MSRIRANTITNQNANGAPNFPDGITVTGIVTATTTNQNITGDLTVTGNVGVGGTITYEDVTNIDSVGVITARAGVNVSSGNINVSSGKIGISSIIPASKFTVKGGSIFVGDNNMHGGSAGVIEYGGNTGHLDLKAYSMGGSSDVRLFTSTGGTNAERLRIGTAGQLGIGGANYGTSGQFLKSTGSGSAVQWATVSTPLVAYKAKEYVRNRYSYSGSSWHEIDTNFRISHTPAATGNTIIIHTQIYHTIADGSIGGFANVTDQGSGSNESMLGEIGNPSGIAKGSILGGSYYNEAIRQSAGGTIGLGSDLWGYHLTENTNAHTFKVFGRMGSGTRYIGDNQPAQFMEMWEYSGNVMQ